MFPADGGGCTITGMDVLQCPVCELRFRSESELDQHLKDDHPSFRTERQT